jgi:hypothetical protein
MATSLTEIIKDPNYVNANSETQRAIFEKYAPLDPNYSNANAATQEAIRFKFGIAQPKFEPRAATPADIPGAIEQPTPAPDGRGILDYIVGGPEAAFTLATGAAAVPISSVAGILTGKLGEGPNKAVQERVMRSFTHQPQTQTARDILGAVGNAVSGLPPYVGTMGAFRPAPAINALRNEAQTIKNFQPFAERSAQRQQQLVTKSYENANLTDAANAANRLGVAVNPAVTNPTIPNRIVGAIAGNPEAKLARTNEPQWTRKAKEDMGLSPNTTLNDQAFGEALKNPLIVEPYDTVRKLGRVTADEDIVNKINALKTESLIGGEASQAAVSKLADETIARLNAGMSGQDILKNIQDFRQSAQRIYRAEKKGVTAPSPESMAVADASMALADQLEAAASLNLTGTQARAFQNARTLSAKIFDYQRATDTRTGHLDPIKFAKITEGKPLTGTASDIATVAANFPGVSEVKPGSWTTVIPTILRGGTGGTLGYGIGSAFGMGPLGAVVGTTSGAVANALMAKRMSSPAYQAANALPRDYRSPANMLRPVEPGSSNLAVFNPENAVLPPEYTPNFTMPGQPPLPPRSAYEAAQQALREEGLRRTGSLGPDMQPAGVPPQLPMPGTEGPAQMRGYEYARDRAAAEAAAAQGAGPRQPAAGGMLYELDPFTGKLQPVGQQVKGPETFTPREQVSTTRRVQQLKDDLWGLINESEPGQSNKEILDLAKKIYTLNLPETAFTPPSGLQNITKPTSPNVLTGYQTTLKSAVGKVMRDERPTMTAEEMIAWNKTRVDLAAADPGYAKLSDKAITEKMMDRKWVGDTIQKARDQARAFEEIAARAKDAQAKRDAIAKRDQLMDLLETLESKYAQPRPTPSPQGPKTRAAKRNALAPQSENNLVP